MADFRDEFSPDLVARLGGEIRGAWPGFPTARWHALATEGLEPLRLLERVGRFADALAATLPGRFADAAGVLHRTLGSATFTGWMTLPCGHFVAAHGIDEPEIALPLLAALSPRFSSEGPIRPFIERHPELTYRCLERWASDPDEHVRRLVSEGTRPRLPWAPHLRSHIADPSPGIALLDRLRDDPSPYVRRSVANHLNDISRDHRDLALATAQRWRDEGLRDERVIRHGLRTLVKRGDPDALRLLGFGGADAVDLAGIACAPERVAIGGEVTLTARITARRPTRAAIDYVVHYMGARGPKAGRVFRLTTRDLETGRTETIVRRHRIAHISIRRIHAGPHRIELQVNGRVLGGCDFDVYEA